jgi:uncharacterized protein (TIGR02246 family)
MQRRTLAGFLLLVALVLTSGWIGANFLSPGHGATQVPGAAPDRKPEAPAEGPEAGIRAITADYARAFNAADAKAAAQLWTPSGEYEGADGVVVQGRDNIEKSLADFFKANPKATAEIRVESIKVMGRGLATVEGIVTLKTPGEKATIDSRYLALHTLEDGKWLAASVKEWVPDPATEVTPQALAWLVGEWTAQGDGGAEVHLSYAWDDDKVFLIGKYRVTREGKVTSHGTQVFGKNPDGGLRSWMFDSSGTTSDAFWVRDDNRWINESVGKLPDGTEIVAANVIIPLGPDAFTWQTTEREINGVPTSGLPPVKVTRVKK